MPTFTIPTEEQWSDARWVVEQFLTYTEDNEPGAVNSINAARQLLEDMGGQVVDSFGG